MLEEAIARQTAVLEDLKKRLTGVQAMLQQGQQEQQKLIADVLHAAGKLEGLNEAKAALTPTRKRRQKDAAGQISKLEHPQAP